MTDLALVKQLEQTFKTEMQHLQSVLPPGLDVKRFCRTAINGLSVHDQADRLLKADRQTLFSACQKAAGDGLLLDGREATLVMFHDKKKNTDIVAYMPMVQGLVKLARNSGEITNLIAEVVFEKDTFNYSPGLDVQPFHGPDWFGERGQPIGAYAVVTTSDDQKIVSILPKNRIIAIGKGGQNADQYVPGKGAHYQEWWKKTVIKNVLKYSPKSSHLESAMQADNQTIDPDKIPPVEKAVMPMDRVRQTPADDPGTDRLARVQQILRDQKAVPLPAPTEQDQQTLQMALDSLVSCKTLEELEQCGQDLTGQLHPDLKGRAVQVYKERRAALDS